MRFRFSLIRAVGVLLAGLTVGGGVTNVGAASAEIATSARRLGVGKTDEAEALLTTALTGAQDDADKAALVVERGWALYLGNFSKLATADVERALKLYPNCQPALLLRARLWIDEKKYDNALRYLRPIAAADSINWHENALLGLALLQRGRAEDKEAACAAIEIAIPNCNDWENYDIQMAHGEMCLTKDQIEEAKRCFEQAHSVAEYRQEPVEKLSEVETAATRVQAARTASAAHLGAAALERKEFSAAAAECEASIKEDTYNDAAYNRLAEVHFAWARALIENGEFNAARKHIAFGHTCCREADRDERAAALNAEVNERANKAMDSAYAQRNFPKVLIVAEEELKNDPADDVARQQQIGALRELKRWPEAIHAYTDAIKHAPKEGGGLSIMMNRAGRDDTIRSCLHDLQQREARGEDVSSDCAALIPDVAYASSSEPTNAGLHFALAQLEVGAKRWGSASSEMDTLVSQTEGPDKLTYILEREKISQRAQLFRTAGEKNYAIAIRLGEAFRSYLDNVALHSRTPTRSDLESALPAIQRSRLEAIRVLSAQREAWSAKVDQTIAECRQLQHQFEQNDNVVTPSEKSRFDELVGQGKAEEKQLEGVHGQLDGAVRDFWNQ